DLIPRDRVIDMAQGDAPTDLALTVSCPCNADAFLFRPDLLVIDIRDGAAAPNSAFEQRFDPPVLIAADIAPPSVFRRVRPVAPFTVPRDPLLPILIPRNRAEPPLAETDDAPPMPAIAPDPPAEVPDTGQSLARLEAAIVQSLAQGLTEGALQGAPRRNAPPDDTGDIAAALDALNLPGVTARTGIDPLAIPGRAPTAVTQEGDACLPDSYFALPAWGSDAPFFEQINPARSALLGEFDAVDSEAVLALARLYAYFGFGREARQALTLDGVQSQARRYLVAMANVIDEDPVAPNLFDQQVSCPGKVALWAMLAQTGNPFDAQVNRVAVLRSFKELPAQMQVHLAPRLSNRFLAIGDTDAALQVITPAQSQPAQPVEVGLADAALSDALGDDAQAIATVTDIARDNPRATPAAMIRFFEDGIAAGTSFTDEDFLNADALRFEVDGSAAALDLAAAQISALISVDRFAQADALLRTASPDIAERADPLADAMLTAATDRMADADFLTFIWGRDTQPRSKDVQNLVAGRLLKLGFAEQALDRLIVSDDPKQQVLRAQAELALGRAAAALTALEGMTGEEVEAVRAAAIAKRTAAETTALIDDGLSALPQDAALRLLPTDDSTFAPLSTAVVTTEGGMLDTPTPLADSRDLLDRAATSRDLLENVLRRFQAPADF
ncbi:MAG: hypothetical protein AAGF56_11325, partial [Pseudomonadota bacterium]